MAITRLTVEEFLAFASTNTVLDVRSPGEYAHAHIPGANSLPLFSDEERKIVGTAYKQESKEKAIKIGLKYFGTKMVKMVNEVEALTKNDPSDKKTVLVHCWRGGMRSAGVAWLLDLYGFKVYTLVGGYKAYRNWVLAQFEKQYPIAIIGGYTGSGKTEVLQSLASKGFSTIDLEGLAHHKGSAFGSLGQLPQPTQEQFENKLAKALAAFSKTKTTSIETEKNLLPEDSNKRILLLEDESQRIGDVNIPTVFFKQMRETKVYFLDIPFDERLAFITAHYGQFEKENLVNAIIRIKKKLGGLETKTAINALIEDDITSCFRVLLHYYDKLYQKGLMRREDVIKMVQKIPCKKVDDQKNALAIIEQSI
ncbi:MAG: tRNA 2-selenouridine(34) synthase MnmH [Sphingobacteriia bacterium]